MEQVIVTKPQEPVIVRPDGLETAVNLKVGLNNTVCGRVTLLQSRAKTDQNWPNNLQVVEGVAGEKKFLI